MDGRRMERRGTRRNPLFSIFIALFLAVVALLVLSIILGVKLKAANKQLAIAEMKIAQYEQQKEEQPEREGPDLGGKSVIQTKPDESSEPAESTEPTKPTESKQENPPKAKETKVGWLDLTGHTEVQTAPKSVFDKYYTYYSAEDVNLRGGPGTNYNRIKLVERGTQINAAAKDGDWTFVSVNGKFGWMKSDYLSTDKPEPEKTEPVEEQPTEQKPAEQTTEQPTEQKPEDIIASPGQINF